VHKLDRVTEDVVDPVAEGTGIPFSQPAVYTLKAKGNGLIAGVPGGDVTIVRSLAALLQPPFHLLYVLHTTRGEAEPGRYQSPELERRQIEQFFDNFTDYLRSDSRFDIWVYAPRDQATLVWDRHDLLHAYGPVHEYERALLGLGFAPGKLSIDFSHIHHYRREYDSDAARLIAAFDWIYSPLRPEDEQ